MAGESGACGVCEGMTGGIVTGTDWNLLWASSDWEAELELDKGDI